jgi:hypothetical protein
LNRTLQELIAPREVLFYDSKQEYIGNKEDLADIIYQITKIDQDHLRSAIDISDASIAKRMSWAAKRKTTREEDQSYCLLGLFGVNMPLLYGEGNEAFFRLQRAIIEKSNDESIFAWTSKSDKGLRGILARSPKEFADSGDVRPSLPRRFKKVMPYQLTNMGLEFYAPTCWYDWSKGAEFIEAEIGILAIRKNTVVLNCVRQKADNAQSLPVVIQLIVSNEATVLYRRNTWTLNPFETAWKSKIRTFSTGENQKHYISLLLRPKANQPRFQNGASYWIKLVGIVITRWILPISFGVLFCFVWWLPMPISELPWPWKGVSPTPLREVLPIALQWAILTCFWQFLNWWTGYGSWFLVVFLCFTITFFFIPWSNGVPIWVW